MTNFYMHPSYTLAHSTRAGYFSSIAAVRRGRETNSPLQLGQFSSFTVQAAQNVHSKEQINAASFGAISVSQHMQLGLSANILHIQQ
jgi:hypothetical protein